MSAALPTRRSARGLVRLVVIALVGATLTLGLGAAGSASAATGKPGASGKPSAAALAAPGTIAVTVTTPDGAAFNGSIRLYAWQAEEMFEQIGSDDLAGASPASYTFDVAPGDYYVRVDDFDDRYATAYSGNASQTPAALTDDGVVHVEPGDGADAAINLVALPDYQTVSGSVENSAGDPVTDFSYQVVRGTGDGEDDEVASGGSSAGGTFHFDVRPGDYEVRIYDESGDYENGSSPVTVADAPVVMDPIVLATIGRYDVSGSVSDAGGPLANASMRLYRLYGTPGSWVDFDWIDDATTDENGHYTFAGVRGSGRYYTVRAQAPGHAARFLGGFTSALDTVGFSPTADVTGADVELPPASTAVGTVAGPDGPASDVRVELYQWYPSSGEGGQFEYTTSGYTDEEGKYTLDSVEAGFYTLYFDTEDSVDPLLSAWLEGTSIPTTTDAPGVFEVTSTPQVVTHDKTLATAPRATGAVTDQSGNPVADASVVSYVWNTEETAWEQYSSTRTKVEGTFGVRVPTSSVVTFRFARGGFTPAFYGGGTSLPTTPDEGNSVTTPANGDVAVAVGTTALARFVSKLGKVAGQDLAYCRTHVVEANDDDSSDAVPIPFDLKYFGTSYDKLYVNNNGNVTFNSALSQYTPSSLTGATNRPIIAPFFADVDTTGAGSNVVTYGASPDGKTFCVNWADVGYYSSNDDKLNTFQLLLTQNTDGAGRSAGDFDITINYDEVLWETGSASGGSGGFGGTSAAAGFSAGTGLPGTFVQLPGSFVNGALLDGGPSSLVAGSENSGHSGRYVYQVRNEGLTSSLGGLRGTVVKDDGGAPVADAYVQACQSSGTGCSYADTDANGEYSFAALVVGDYQIRVWPPSDSLFGGGGAASVVAGDTTTAPEIRLAAPLPPPAGTTITSNGSGSNGVPSVFYGEDLDLVVTGCAGVASPTYTVTLADGTVLRDHLAMTESPAGTYSATIPQFYPTHGEAQISTNVPVTCNGEPVAFNVYIDPSGVVTDQWGRPIQGASATLLRSDTSNGTYTTVPDGSDIMSAGNRSNPTLTNSAGYFQWDVQVGWYKVTLEATGCATGTTPAMEVPPERIDLLVPLTCSGAAPAPTAAPSISGQLAVGHTITPVAAQWAAPLVPATGTTKLLRNGTPVTLTGGSYTLTAGDVGATFSATSTGARPDYVQEAGAGSTVTFTPVTVTSSGQTATLGAAPTATSGPSITGSGKVGTTLTAVAPTWSASGVTDSRQWLRGGAPIAGATGPTYDVAVADLGQAVSVRFTGSRAGYADGTATSAAVTGVLGDGASPTTAPAITGTPKVGQTLTASAGTWSGTGLGFIYQWARAGVPIAGATGPTYKATVQDAGKALTVRVVATWSGHPDSAATSAPVTVAKLASGLSAKLKPTTIAVGGKSKLSGVLTVPGVKAPTGTLVVYDGKKKLKTVKLTAKAKGKYSLTLTKLKAGSHKLTVSYVGTPSIAGAKAKTVTLKVTKAKKKKKKKA